MKSITLSLPEKFSKIDNFCIDDIERAVGGEVTYIEFRPVIVNHPTSETCIIKTKLATFTSTKEIEEEIKIGPIVVNLDESLYELRKLPFGEYIEINGFTLIMNKRNDSAQFEYILGNLVLSRYCGIAVRDLDIPNLERVINWLLKLPEVTIIIR